MQMGKRQPAASGKGIQRGWENLQIEVSFAGPACFSGNILKVQPGCMRAGKGSMEQQLFHKPLFSRCATQGTYRGKIGESMGGEPFRERPAKRLSPGQAEALKLLRDHVFRVCGAARVPPISHSHSTVPPVQQPETLGIPFLHQCPPSTLCRENLTSCAL